MNFFILSIPQDDNRVSLTIGDKHFLALQNVVTDSEECFEIVDKEGRVGSFSVYRALICTKTKERQRPVLLKEFYPKKFQKALYRDSDIALHKLDVPTESETFRQFQTNSTCQRKFLGDLAQTGGILFALSRWMAMSLLNFKGRFWAATVLSFLCRHKVVSAGIKSILIPLNISRNLCPDEHK